MVSAQSGSRAFQSGEKKQPWKQVHNSRGAMELAVASVESSADRRRVDMVPGDYFDQDPWVKLQDAAFW